MSILFNTLVQNRVFFNKMYKRIREQEVTYKKTRQKYGFCIALYSTTKNKIIYLIWDYKEYFIPKRKSSDVFYIF
jgi:hypothetical protein